MGELTLPLPTVSLHGLTRRVLESLTWKCTCGRVKGLTNSTKSQAQIQVFELAHPKIYIICQLLENLKGLVLLI